VSDATGDAEGGHMSSTVKTLKKMGSVGFIVCTVLASLLTGALAQSKLRPARTGGDWLSWTQQTRNDFVEAYLAGYVEGKSGACEAAAEIFGGGKTVSDPRDDPSQRCIRQAKSYSKDVLDYVSVITDFYTNYPQFRKIPDLYLMMILRDDEYTTSDGIYRRAQRGEIRTNF
jgi:hypothetical protein